MTPDLATVLAAIRARQSEAIADGFELVGVVGSVARGEANDASDVDIVYRIAGSPTLFGLARTKGNLEDRLGVRVDLVNFATVPDRIRASLERDLVVA